MPKDSLRQSPSRLVESQIIEELQDLQTVVEVDLLVLAQFHKGELHSVRIIVDEIESGFQFKLLRRPSPAYKGRALNLGLSAGGGI